MKLKRIICILLILGMNFLRKVDTFAFYSRAHWTIAQLISETKPFNTLYDKQNLFYKSGAIIADIGKFNWDKTYIASDSFEFADKLLLQCRDDCLEEKLFALGWFDHASQDKYGSILENVFNDGNYMLRCGQIEKYLSNNGKYFSPFDNTEAFYINCNMIRKTYELISSGKYSPSNAEIYFELNKMFVAVNMASMFSNIPMNSTEIKNLNSEMKRLSILCHRSDSYKKIQIDKCKPCITDYAKLEGIPKKIEISVTNCDESLANLLLEINKIAYFQKMGKYKEFTGLKYVVTDKIEYEKLLSKLFRMYKS